MRLRGNLFVLLAALLALSMAAPAKDKRTKSPPKDPQDAIEVIGHIPLSNGAVQRFLSTQHYSSYYLYVEYEAGKSVTLIDVTKAAQPSMLADVPYPFGDGSGSLFAVAGTAALVSEAQATSPQPALAQTIRIMDFSDPKQPKVAREFAGVTAITRDDRRGLIFLANADGVWILHQNFAQDPEVEKEYTRHVLYDH